MAQRMNTTTAEYAPAVELFEPSSSGFAQAGDESAYSEDKGVELATLQLETWGRQLILTSEIAFEVADVRAAYERVQTVAAAEGALITSANLHAGQKGKPDSYGQATLVLRMPQECFSAIRKSLLNVAGELDGKVLKDQVSSQDVTEQYIDLKSRLRHWQSQEVQLLEVMSKARAIKDILAVRNQLSEVQQEIERISGKLRFLENRIDLSTITVQISRKSEKPAKVEPTVAEIWKDARKEINAAWNKSVQDLVKAVGWLIMVLTYIMPFAVVAAVVLLAVRIVRRKTMAKKSG